MKTIASLLLLILLSSYTLKITCDTDKLYGKWLLIDSYDEGTVTVDSLLRTNVDSLLKDDIVPSTGAYMIYQKNEIAVNGLGSYSTHELYTLYKADCKIQHLSVISYVYRFTYILYIDDSSLITSEKGRIYFYKKEKDY